MQIAAFRWINEFPDCTADASAGKRTLVVRLGRRRASRVFAGLQGLALAGYALLPLVGLPSTALLALAGAPFALVASVRLWREPERTPAIVPAQRNTLLAFVLGALGLAMGVTVLA